MNPPPRASRDTYEGVTAGAATPVQHRSHCRARPNITTAAAAATAIMLRHTRRALATKVIIPRHRDGIRLQKGETLADAKCVASRGGTVVHASVSWRCASTEDAHYDTGGGAPLLVDFRHPSSAGPATFDSFWEESVRASDQEIWQRGTSIVH